MQQRAQRDDAAAGGLSTGRKVLIVVIGAIVAGFGALHLVGGGLHHGR